MARAGRNHFLQGRSHPFEFGDLVVHVCDFRRRPFAHLGAVRFGMSPQRQQFIDVA